MNTNTQVPDRSRTGVSTVLMRLVIPASGLVRAEPMGTMSAVINTMGQITPLEAAS